MPTASATPQRTRVTRIALTALLAVAFVLATAWLDGGTGIAPAALWNHPDWVPWWSPPLRMACNALPGLLLGFALFTGTRRIGWSLALAFGVQALLYGANALKVANLAIPLLPADFHMLGQLRHGGGALLAGYVPHRAWLVAAGIAAVAALALWFRLEPPLLAARPRRARGAASALLWTALATLLAGVPAWRSVYDAQRLGMQPWSPIATRQHDGLVGSLLLFHLQYAAQRQRPDVSAALALMQAYAPAIAAAQGVPAGASKPDIVVILSESFFDPTIMNGYPPGTDLTPNLHRLARQGLSGQLHVPTFGGGTVRTEFEVLTGLSLRYFPDVQFPYLQIHQKRVPGIVRLLAADGYATIAVHGHNPGFWNRTQAFKELGFDRFLSIGDFPDAAAAKDGHYVSDAAFTSEVLRQLPDAGPPRFVLGISIEAHGPYTTSPGIDAAARDAIPVPAAVTDPDARRELQNYIYHMQHADQQLGRLVDTLAARKRRTLILFFGDHLPALMPAFEAAGFRNGESFLTQTVPYLLIDTADMQHASQADTATWALPDLLLARAGLQPDPYFALTGLVAPQLAALTRAPDAPRIPETPAQKQLDTGMRNVATLRLREKLYKLWPQAAAMAARASPTAPGGGRGAPLR